MSPADGEGGNPGSRRKVRSVMTSGKRRGDNSLPEPGEAGVGGGGDGVETAEGVRPAAVRRDEGIAAGREDDGKAGDHEDEGKVTGREDEGKVTDGGDEVDVDGGAGGKLRRIRRGGGGGRRRRLLRIRSRRTGEEGDAWRREWFRRTVRRRRRNLMAVLVIFAMVVAATFVGISDRESDPDGDGLSNAREAGLGTDPDRKDTDGDGLDDGWEVEHGFDPLDKDMDNDMIPDGEEIEAGADGFVTDPRNPDTDGDGLDDWEEVNPGADGFVTYPFDHDTDDDGMDDGWESGNGLNPLWPGDTGWDNDTDGNFSYEMVQVGGGNETRLEYILVYNPFIAIEEYLHRTDPWDHDTDGDTLRDGWEAEYGLNPLLHTDEEDDSDQDQLSARDEMFFFTDPRDPDTDRDGLGDGVEHGHGLNGTNWDTDGDSLPDGWEFTYNGNKVGSGVMDPRAADSDGDGLNDSVEDADSDGLVNVLEFFIGTGPLTPDSDGDDMPDGWEFSMGLDPLNASDHGEDLDGDNLTNLEELHLGTDAGEEDTDGDGLTDTEEVRGFPGRLIDGVWYDEWGGGGGDPGAGNMTVTDPLLADTDGDDLTDDEDGDGNSDPEEEIIDNRDNDGDGLIDEEWDLNDYNEVNGYDKLGAHVWERTRTDPSSVDTDGDGLNDTIECPESLAEMAQIAGLTSARETDPDGDGLTDPEEDLDGDGYKGPDETDPWDADTDDDGLDDGEEVLTLGTDPLSADTDEDKMKDGWEVRSGLDPLKDDSGDDPDNDGVWRFMGTQEELEDWVWLTAPFPGSYWEYDPFTNLEEYRLYLVKFTGGAEGIPDSERRSDPHARDTDGDGVPDGWEVAVHENGHPNPLVPDGHLDPDDEVIHYRASDAGDVAEGADYSHHFTTLDEYRAGRDLDGDGWVDFSPFNPSHNMSIDNSPPLDGMLVWEADYDGDGLGNGWEMLFGGWLTLQEDDYHPPKLPLAGTKDRLDPWTINDGGLNSDGDNLTDMEEYLAGLPWIYPEQIYNSTKVSGHGAYDPYDALDNPVSRSGGSRGYPAGDSVAPPLASVSGPAGTLSVLPRSQGPARSGRGRL